MPLIQYASWTPRKVFIFKKVKTKIFLIFYAICA